MSSRGSAGWMRLAALYLLLGVLVVLGQPRPSDLWLGLPLVVAGGALRVWAAGHLVKTRDLVMTGPYAHLRHPLYLGRLLLFAGFVLMARMPGLAHLALLALGLTAFFTVYLPRKERIEGERLHAVHRERFAPYRQAVPALVPRLRPWRPYGVESPGRWRFSRFWKNREPFMLAGEAAVVTLFAARALA